MSPRSDEQNQQIRDDRREQILQAALLVFAHKGLAAAKIGDIATAAGLSHGLVYHYFASKDEIFTALVEQALDASLYLINGSLKHPGTPLEKIRKMIETLIPAAYQEVGPYYFLMMIQAFTSDAVPAEVKSLAATKGNSYAELLIPVIIEGQKLGEIAPGDPQRMSVMFFALIQGLAISQIQSRDANQLPTSEMVLRIFQSGADISEGRVGSPLEEKSEYPSVERKFTGDFGPIRLTEHPLTYRMRTGPDSRWTLLHSAISQINEDGVELNRIEETDESNGKMLAMVRADDWKPVRVETFSLQGEPIVRLEYAGEEVFIEKHGPKGKKALKIRDKSYDMNTLNFVFRAFPFDQKEQVDFDVVMDGRYGTPVGVFSMVLRAKGRERIQTPAGSFECYRLELGVGGAMAIFAAKYKYDFWYTVDEPRFLVKYEDREGNLVELTGSTNETTQNERAIRR